MFWQLIKGALMRQRNRFMLIALTVALGVSLASAMLNVMFDVGDKVNQELKAYGANITVVSKNTALLKDVYGLSDESTHRDYLNESELGKLKTIFWTNNIVAFAPSLEGTLTLEDGSKVPAIGTWFEHTMNLPTGESFVTGEKEMKSWWQIEGNYPIEGQNEALVGQKLAQAKNIKVGDTIKHNGGELKVSGIVSGGGDEDNSILTDLSIMQTILNLPGKIDSIDVSAITTPENDLARKAAANPDLLSQQEREIWYCTAYVSAIAYQIEEVINNSSARPVRQIAESEGKILDKTQLLMLLITILSLLSAVLGVSNLVSANIIERSRELGLLKAIGATDLNVIILVLTEIFIAGCIGGFIGYFAGLGLAQIIGITVFGSGIANNTIVMPITSVLILLVLLFGSLPAIRMLLSLQPAEVLHGR